MKIFQFVAYSTALSHLVAWWQHFTRQYPTPVQSGNCREIGREQACRI